MAVYRACCDELVPVSSPDAAELSKLLENIFRSVNIAFINEMAIMCDRMGIDVWEVVAAAATKPFGFMKFLPGPGLGGHCLPLDPFYLAWRAREFDYYTEFIELAGKVNENMPYFCVAKIARALNGVQRSVRGSRVLVLGLAYKANIDDIRESPAEKIIALLEADGGDASPTTTRTSPAARWHALGAARRRDADRLRLRGDRHRAHSGRLRPRGRSRAARRRPPQRDRRRWSRAAHVHKL